MGRKGWEGERKEGRGEVGDDIFERRSGGVGITMKGRRRRRRRKKEEKEDNKNQQYRIKLL